MIDRLRGMPAQPSQACTALAVNLAGEDGRSLARILRGSNWRLQEVRTCQEALDLARHAPAPAVLCDPRMPDGNWHTLMDGLRRLPDPPAVIVVSRFADERLWIEVLSAGGYDVLAIPLEPSELLRVLFLAWRARKAEAGRVPARARKPPAAEQIADVSLQGLRASSRR